MGDASSWIIQFVVMVLAATSTSSHKRRIKNGGGFSTSFK